MPIPSRLLPDSRLVARLVVVAVGCYCMGIGANVLLGELLERFLHYSGVEFSGDAMVDVSFLSEEGTFLLVSLGAMAEELIFRTVGFAVLRGEGLSNLVAVVLTSLAFGLVHFQGGYVHVIAATMFGLLLGGLYLLQPSFGFIRSAAAHTGINHATYGLALLYPETVARTSVLLPGWGYGLAFALLAAGLWVTIKVSTDGASPQEELKE